MAATDDVFEALVRSGYDPDDAADMADDLASQMEPSRLSRLSDFMGRQADTAGMRASDRLVPNFKEVPREAVNQPRRLVGDVAEQGSNTITGVAKWGAVGATGVVAAPAALNTVNNYFDRQTQKEISKNRQSMIQALRDVLADDSLSFDQKKKLINEILALNKRPGPDGSKSNDGLFTITLPFVGTIEVSPAMVGAAFILLWMVVSATNAPKIIPTPGGGS